MTCREFKHDAASLNLWELSRTEDQRILGHAEKCESCTTWLKRQRALAVSMQSLQARTASLEAGPDVERALLRAFRQDTLHRADHVFERVGERSGSMRPAVTPTSTPVALRLSRLFEIGAYVAVAAAVLVGVFLGVRLLQHTYNAAPVESKVAPAVASPVTQAPAASAELSKPAEPVAHPQLVAAPERHTRAVAGKARTAEESADDDSASYADAGYTALMFCDPLSCADDTQVVRMQVEGNGPNAQPQTADVVVGYDGLVRAVRMVN